MFILSAVDSLTLTGSSLWIFQAFVLFVFSNKTLWYFAPARISQSKLYWRWRNTSNSMFHATITGIWAICCFLFVPEISEDLIINRLVAAHALVAFSIGYFFYDFTDTVLNQPLRKCWDILAHHLVVLVAFGITIVTKRYTGYAVCALLVELNSIFLHWRKVLSLSGRTKSSMLYRIVSIANIVSFLLFRIGTFIFMSWWQWRNWNRIPSFFAYFAATGLVIIIVMNIVLLRRLLQIDFIAPSRKEVGAKKEKPKACFANDHAVM